MSEEFMRQVNELRETYEKKEAFEAQQMTDMHEAKNYPVYHFPQHEDRPRKKREREEPKQVEEKDVSVRRLQTLPWKHGTEATLYHLPHDLLAFKILRYFGLESLFAWLEVSTFTYHDAVTVLQLRAKEIYGCEDAMTLSCSMFFRNHFKFLKEDAQRLFPLSDAAIRKYRKSLPSHVKWSYSPENVIRCVVAEYGSVSNAVKFVREKKRQKHNNSERVDEMDQVIGETVRDSGLIPNNVLKHIEKYAKSGTGWNYDRCCSVLDSLKDLIDTVFEGDKNLFRRYKEDAMVKRFFGRKNPSKKLWKAFKEELSKKRDEELGAFRQRQQILEAYKIINGCVGYEDYYCRLKVDEYLASGDTSSVSAVHAKFLRGELSVQQFQDAVMRSKEYDIYEYRIPFVGRKSYKKFIATGCEESKAIWLRAMEREVQLVCNLWDSSEEIDEVSVQKISRTFIGKAQSFVLTYVLTGDEEAHSAIVRIAEPAVRELYNRRSQFFKNLVFSCLHNYLAGTQTLEDVERMEKRIKEVVRNKERHYYMDKESLHLFGSYVSGKTGEEEFLHVMKRVEEAHVVGCSESEVIQAIAKQYREGQVSEERWAELYRRYRKAVRNPTFKQIASDFHEPYVLGHMPEMEWQAMESRYYEKEERNGKVLPVYLKKIRLEYVVGKIGAEAWEAILLRFDKHGAVQYPSWLSEKRREYIVGTLGSNEWEAMLQRFLTPEELCLPRWLDQKRDDYVLGIISEESWRAIIQRYIHHSKVTYPKLLDLGGVILGTIAEAHLPMMISRAEEYAEANYQYLWMSAMLRGYVHLRLSEQRWQEIHARYKSISKFRFPRWMDEVCKNYVKGTMSNADWAGIQSRWEKRSREWTGREGPKAQVAWKQEIIENVPGAIDEEREKKAKFNLEWGKLALIDDHGVYGERLRRANDEAQTNYNFDDIRVRTNTVSGWKWKYYQ